MVIKEISKLCQRRRTAVIYDDYCRRTQWISDERTFYPTFGLPRLDTETLPYVLDIPEGKQAKMLFDRNVELPDQLNFSDYDNTEQVLPRAGATVSFRNEVFLPVRTSLGLMFIDPEQLKPLKDIEAEIELYERMAKNGEPYVVAKRGLELKAVILPIYQGEQLLLEEMETLTKELSQSISRRKMMEQVDPKTGEVKEK